MKMVHGEEGTLLVPLSIDDEIILYNIEVGQVIRFINDNKEVLSEVEVIDRLVCLKVRLRL